MSKTNLLKVVGCVHCGCLITNTLLGENIPDECLECGKPDWVHEVDKLHPSHSTVICSKCGFVVDRSLELFMVLGDDWPPLACPNCKEPAWVFTGFDLTSEEETAKLTILAARTIQTFLWGKSNGEWGLEEWKRMFRKRVAKLDAISEENPHAAVELKKRLLQTAALAVALIAVVEEKGGIPQRSEEAPPSNLPQYSNPIGPTHEETSAEETD